MARAAFEALHARFHRPRNWDRHPDDDQDVELGRESFRAMAKAMLRAQEDAGLSFARKAEAELRALPARGAFW